VRRDDVIDEDVPDLAAEAQPDAQGRIGCEEFIRLYHEVRQAAARRQGGGLVQQSAGRDSIDVAPPPAQDAKAKKQPKKQPGKKGGKAAKGHRGSAPAVLSVVSEEERDGSTEETEEDSSSAGAAVGAAAGAVVVGAAAAEAAAVRTRKAPRRPPANAEVVKEFKIKLHKPEGQVLGLSVDTLLLKTETSCPLVVKKVSGGLLGDHNKENPDEALLANDLIVRVNGQEGTPAKQLQALKRSGDVELDVRRLAAAKLERKGSGRRKNLSGATDGSSASDSVPLLGAEGEEPSKGPAGAAEKLPAAPKLRAPLPSMPGLPKGVKKSAAAEDAPGQQPAEEPPPELRAEPGEGDQAATFNAEKKLEEAMANNDEKTLTEAIAAAAAAGVSKEAIEKGQKFLVEGADKRAKARREDTASRLKAAVAAPGDLKALREAVAAAEAEQLPGPDVKQAQEVLAREEKKQSARDALAELKDCNDAAKLEAGISAALAAGLADDASEPTLVAAQASRERAARRAAAEAELAAAVQALDLGRLRAAIQGAEAAGAEPDKVQHAKQVLEEEEPKQRAREALKAACEARTKEALMQAIEAAKAAKLEASEYSEAAELLSKEEEKERMLAALKKCMEDVKDVDMKSIDAVRAAKEALSAAIATAQAAGVPEAELKDPELRRKKLHNTVEDLKGSIRVFCRVRPLSSKENHSGDTDVTKQADPMTLEVVKDAEGGKEKYSYDAVFTPGTQEEIFEDCKDLVQSAVDGYNVTLFAYGQTGAGKTFTMAGVPGQLGITPRTISELFSVIGGLQHRFDFTLTGSMLELYRQDIVDLLAKGVESQTRRKALNVRQDKSGAVVIENLTEEVVKSSADLDQVVDRGNQQRTVAATQMNSESSRSHLVLIVKIQSVNKETGDKMNGKILIVDLAGSERLKKSMTTAENQKESIEINKSLTALGDVIEALTKTQKQVPYRNHKLTQLMQDSLGGTAKTLMFVNCSPASSNLEETLMSLKYAARAKKITNATKTNVG